MCPCRCAGGSGPLASVAVPREPADVHLGDAEAARVTGHRQRLHPAVVPGEDAVARGAVRQPVADEGFAALRAEHHGLGVRGRSGGQPHEGILRRIPAPWHPHLVRAVTLVDGGDRPAAREAEVEVVGRHGGGAGEGRVLDADPYDVRPAVRALLGVDRPVVLVVAPHEQFLRHARQFGDDLGSTVVRVRPEVVVALAVQHAVPAGRQDLLRSLAEGVGRRVSGLRPPPPSRRRVPWPAARWRAPRPAPPRRPPPPRSASHVGCGCSCTGVGTPDPPCQLTDSTHLRCEHDQPYSDVGELWSEYTQTVRRRVFATFRPPTTPPPRRGR